jgi:hypothetical protein
MVEFESILCVKSKEGELVGFYRNDIDSRSIKLYSCKEMSLDEIKELHEKLERTVMK